jgi:hypothetical protein
MSISLLAGVFDEVVVRMEARFEADWLSLMSSKQLGLVVLAFRVYKQAQVPPMHKAVPKLR